MRYPCLLSLLWSLSADGQASGGTNVPEHEVGWDIQMAFEMDGEFVVPASREEVWKGLNDPDVLCRSIQGCQELRRTGENSFLAKVKMKIGPVAAVFDGKVDLCDIDPPNSYRIEGQGDGGAAGFAKGGANVNLSEADGGTLLRYCVNADIGGRLAQLGGRLINGVARKQADLFFANFAAQFAGTGEPELAAAEAASGLPPYAPMPTAPSQPAAALVPSMLSRSPVPWVTMVALALGVLAGFLLGKSDAADWWVLAVAIFGIACVGVGIQAGRNGRS